MIYSYPEKSNENDHLVMYFIVRESLNMSLGKTAAQVGHAAQMILLEYFSMKSIQNTILFDSTEEMDEFKNKLYRMQHWLNDKIDWLENNIKSSFRKVILRADEKEWVKIKNELKPIIVVDAGFTELEPNTETVMVLFPLFKNECPKAIKKLQCI